MNDDKEKDKYEGYSQLYKDAMAAVELAEAKAKEYTEREGFKYDVNTDEIYKQYSAAAKRSGELAMKDTMAKAAGLTGGYASTYAQSAGQAAYKRELDAVDNIIPELYDRAYAEYEAEGQKMLNDEEVLRKRAESIYKTSPEYLAAVAAGESGMNVPLLMGVYEAYLAEKESGNISSDTTFSDWVIANGGQWEYESINAGSGDAVAAPQDVSSRITFRSDAEWRKDGGEGDNIRITLDEGTDDEEKIFVEKGKVADLNVSNALTERYSELNKGTDPAVNSTMVYNGKIYCYLPDEESGENRWFVIQKRAWGNNTTSGDWYKLCKALGVSTYGRGEGSED